MTKLRHFVINCLKLTKVLGRPMEFRINRLRVQLACEFQNSPLEKYLKATFHQKKTRPSINSQTDHNQAKYHHFLFNVFFFVIDNENYEEWERKIEENPSENLPNKKQNNILIVNICTAKWWTKQHNKWK